MLLNALFQIGNVLGATPKSSADSVNLDEDIKNYIDVSYDPISSDHIFKINIYKPVIEFLRNLEERIGKIDLNQFIGKELTEEDKKNIVEQIVNENELKECRWISIEPFEYKRELDYKMLRGERSGREIYYSPTLTAKISQQGLSDFPLWKIKLNLKDNNLLNTEGLSNEDKELYNFTENFYDYIPNLDQMKKLENNEPRTVIRLIIAEIFKILINQKLKEFSKKYKKNQYYFPICLEGKWPYEIRPFVEYYKNKIGKMSSKKKGTCECCGEQTDVDDGLTKELGFYSTDQKSFTYIFHKNKQYQICSKCEFKIKKGFNHVMENLNIYLGNRGTNKNPARMYVIPIVANSNDLAELLNQMKFKSTKSIQTIDENIENLGDKIKKEEKNEEETQEPDIFKLFDKELVNKIPYSLLLITYYQSEGQSKDFCNIMGIDFINYEKIVKLSEFIYKLKKEENEKFSFKDIYYIFGLHKFKTYISKMLNLKKLEVENICKDAYLNMKIDFFKLLSDPLKESSYLRLNLRRFNTYLKLVGGLNLI